MIQLFYVYVYLDPRKSGKFIYGKYIFDYEPFYIGKGRGSRAYIHLKHICSNNKYFYNKINKILRETGKNPIILKYKEDLVENVSFEFEKEMIDIIGRKDLKRGPLCNLTDGGEGISGYKRSDEQKQRMKITNKNKISDIGRKNMSKSHFGLHHSKETKKKMSESATGIKNHNCIYNYYLTKENGEIIKIEALKEFMRQNEQYKNLMDYCNKNKKYKDIINIRKVLKLNDRISNCN